MREIMPADLDTLTNEPEPSPPLYFGRKERSYATEFEAFMTAGSPGAKAQLTFSLRQEQEVVDIYHFPAFNFSILYLWGIDRLGGNTKVFSSRNRNRFGTIYSDIERRIVDELNRR